MNLINCFKKILLRWYTFKCKSCGYQWEADVSSSSQTCPNCNYIVTGTPQ